MGLILLSKYHSLYLFYKSCNGLPEKFISLASISKNTVLRDCWLQGLPVFGLYINYMCSLGVLDCFIPIIVATFIYWCCNLHWSTWMAYKAEIVVALSLLPISKFELDKNSSEMLHNLPYFWNTKTHIVLSFCATLFFP